MSKNLRVVIQDLNKATMPEVTGMIVSDYKELTGNLIQFRHPDGSLTVINIAPGWNVTIEAEDED